MFTAKYVNAKFMNILRYIFSICVVMLTPAFVINARTNITAINSTQRKQLIDDAWQFTLVQNDKGEQVPTSFQMVDLPHDWSILNDFTEGAAMGNDGGYLPAGKGLYKKTLVATYDDIDKGRHLLYLEGAYMDAHVFVNDSLVGYRPYGYSSVLYDLSSYLKPGENELSISVDNSQQRNARWYTGSGIYRHVWLLNLPNTHVKPWSVYITTPKVEKYRSTVKASFDVNGQSDGFTASVYIKNSDGKLLYETNTPINSESNNVEFKDVPLELWDIDTPYIYTLEICLKDKDGNMIDTVDETFGVRKIEYSVSEGFKLNDRPVLLTGACVHSDNGLIGARSYDAAEAHKVKMLKEAGFNAVRTSHNHPAPSFLDECDRQGILVIDEAFDGWRWEKKPFDYSKHIDQWWDADLKSLVLRDRNHPSIICWSIGNEVIERKQIEVVKTAKKLADLCRELDPTRPVTSALCTWDHEWDIFDPLAAELDIVGYNYLMHKAEDDHNRVPDRIMWQTESYPRDAFDNWSRTANLPYVIGDFVWTGIDYLGESGIGKYYYAGENNTEFFVSDQWPWHSSYCGDIDLIWQRKPISHYREILFSDKPSLFMYVKEPEGYYGSINESMWGTYPSWESWTWPGYEGKTIEIEVITKFPAVRLYVNGSEYDTKKVTYDTRYKAVFSVPYEAGNIKAVALDKNGDETDYLSIMETAGNPAAVKLTANRNLLTANNQDLIFVLAEVVDKNGNLVPIADNEITFSVLGEGELIGSGSADPKSTQGYHRPNHKAWKGKVGAVIKSTGKPGNVIIKAEAIGLKVAQIKLKSQRQK